MLMINNNSNGGGKETEKKTSRETNMKVYSPLIVGTRILPENKRM